MVVKTCNGEMSFNVPLNRIWNAGACDDHILFPKVMPEYFAGAEIAGDGGPGSVKTFHFTQAVKEGNLIKDYVEVLDHASHTLKYKVIEGSLIPRLFKSHSFEVKFESTGANSSAAKLKIEYETLDNKPLSEEETKKMIEGITTMLKSVEGYLLANPGAYA